MLHHANDTTYCMKAETLSLITRRPKLTEPAFKEEQTTNYTSFSHIQKSCLTFALTKPNPLTVTSSNLNPT